jgi:hypothetical protein
MDAEREGVFVLIVVGDRPAYYVFSKLTATEYRYLDKLNGTNIEGTRDYFLTVNKDKEGYEMVCYVYAALGFFYRTDIEELKDLGNAKECLAAVDKWINNQMGSLGEVNEKYGGSIDAVFCLCTSVL